MGADILRPRALVQKFLRTAISSHVEALVSARGANKRDRER